MAADYKRASQPTGKFSRRSLQMEGLTGKDYLFLSESDRQKVKETFKNACSLVLKEDFELYMKYDQSCESAGGSIPSNMLKNALLCLTATQSSNCVRKIPAYYRNYYGQTSWKPIITKISEDLETLFGEIHIGMNAIYFGDSLSDVLTHMAWAKIYSK